MKRLMEMIALIGFGLAIFSAGVAVGKTVEKINRLDHRIENKEHKNTSKNDRR